MAIKISMESSLITLLQQPARLLARLLLEHLFCYVMEMLLTVTTVVEQVPVTLDEAWHMALEVMHVDGCVM
jgi:hypothetical protein